MANLTLAIDVEVLRKARIAALERDTSLNDLIRIYLENLAGGEGARRIGAVEELKALYGKSTAVVGNINWTRDDLHER